MTTPVGALILLLEDFQRLPPLAQLGAATSCIGAFGGSIFWAWRTGRKNVAQEVETNGKLKQELEDSAVRTRKIERRDRRARLHPCDPAGARAGGNSGARGRRQGACARDPERAVRPACACGRHLLPRDGGG